MRKFPVEDALYPHILKVMVPCTAVEGMELSENVAIVVVDAFEKVPAFTPAVANPSKLYCTCIMAGPVEVLNASKATEVKKACFPEFVVIENSQYFPAVLKLGSVDQDPENAPAGLLEAKLTLVPLFPVARLLLVTLASVVVGDKVVEEVVNAHCPIISAFAAIVVETISKKESKSFFMYDKLVETIVKGT
ncbi:hypothetical protein COLO4_02231 [Corchorus olitorius]|uniref:Uncharacterized protein n=1 Tax=Corchorus olitorius TaxID=93759 RepID=A0A1R3L1H4_9ROSI|nr:hypothetical protein COLO4_02231 [Corchorus olitorius]